MLTGIGRFSVVIMYMIDRGFKFDLGIEVHFNSCLHFIQQSKHNIIIFVIDFAFLVLIC